MKNEVMNVEQLENEISVIEMSHHNAILSVHDNMQELVIRCEEIVVSEDDKESYESAVELKRLVKSVHVGIEKKRKELKQPLIDYGKRLDKWVTEIYEPLVKAEKVVKAKMEVYEKRQEELKEERKLIEEKEREVENELTNKLRVLNSQLEKINSAKSKKELDEIRVYLDGINLSDFGDKSAEAGFILNQLKLTCSMAYRLLKDEEEVVVNSKIETTPITDELIEQLKVNEIPISKKVIEKNESVVNEQISIDENKDDVVVLEEKDNNVVTNLTIDFKEESNVVESENLIQVENEFKNATDEDLINIIDCISKDVIDDVLLMINQKTSSLIRNKTAFDKINFPQHNQLILMEVKKRVGVLLSK
jgi:hypothetical protein